MNSDSASRKRKNPSSPNKMGALLSKFFRKSDEVKPEEVPSSSKMDDNVEEASRIAAGAEDIVNDDNKVQPSPSKLDEDGPPALDRQDDQPSEELPLDDTPDSSPAPSPVKKDKKKADEEVEVDKVVEKRSSLRLKKKTIADFGYHFNDEGKLRTIEGDEGFKFTTQKEYEALGEAIGDRVYELMEEQGLEKRYLEIGGNRRFYFVSPDYEQKERVLVLIHGSGVVKAGQWARKLIINESLDRGTQLPYIKRGLENGWGVVVINYNERCVGQEMRCHSPEAHGTTEWRFAFEHAREDADIVVVAHSAGGSVISEVVRRMHRKDDDRVLCVALTDSWFSEGKQVYAVNWNTTKKQLHRSNGTWQMYSGDNTHEGTSASCINAAFALLEGVRPDMELEEFHELLEDCEQIIMKEFQERIRKKREAKEGGDTTSTKSLELDEAKYKDEVTKKEKKEDKEEQKENAEEEEKDKKKEEGEEKKEDKKAEEEEGKDKEKKEDKKDDVTEQKAEVAAAPSPPWEERNPADGEEEDSDEGVEKDASTPPGKSDAEN